MPDLGWKIRAPRLKQPAYDESAIEAKCARLARCDGAHIADVNQDHAQLADENRQFQVNTAYVTLVRRN